MQRTKLVKEKELAKLAKVARKKTKFSKAEVARQLGVTRATIHQAEEYPEMSLTSLRIRMIEKYSPAIVSGPLFKVE